MKKTRILIVLLLAGAVLASFAQRKSAGMQKLMNAQYAISQFYVDTVNEDQLIEGAIEGMLKQLDPHSTYTDPKATRELEEPLQGEFSGIGIQFNMKEDTLYVIQTIAGGPSERVGILAGDRIVSVNDTTIAGVKMTNKDIMRRLRGPKGTKVNVMVKRGSKKELIPFRITRDNIPLYSIDAKFMLDKTTGYILISRFGAKTHEEMVDAIEDLKRQGMKRLIIDLGSNGGGYLSAASDMANEFLEKGQMIVYTEGEHSVRQNLRAQGNGRYRDMPLVVMVDQYSASASEIFAGAMQDWDRAIVVGRRSFGKGLVQRPIHFDDGSMMRLTVARYYTPAGRCIQKPYIKGDKESYEEDLADRSNAGEYYHVDSIPFNDSLRCATLRAHRPIYGGGGIVPDVFVPLDTTEYSIYYRNMMAKGIINQFAIDYVDRHRSDIKGKYATLEDFDRNFALTDADMKDFIARGERDSVKYDEKQYRTSENVFRTMIKGLIARDVYSDPGAYTYVMRNRNTDLTAALAIFDDEKQFKSLLQNGNPEYERIAARQHDERVKAQNKNKNKK